MNLSEHFTLEELTASDSAVRLGIANVAGAEEEANLRRLCAQVLEPLRSAIGRPIRVTSGLRVPLLNTIVGGSRTSDHCTGRAADIQVEGMAPLAVCLAIRSLGLPYKQLIHEFGTWCHVSVPPLGEAPAREDLTARKVAGKTEYIRGVS